MILSERSIQQIRDIPPSDVISHYVQLKQRGASHHGLCPFHNEKTPSFTVTDSKSIFKCFGCGEGGDAISFVMKHDKLGFIEAIEKIASLLNITLEYEEVADKEKWEAEKSLKDKMRLALQVAVDAYRKNLWELPPDHPVILYLEERKITKNIITEWQIGWSGENWRSLTPQLISLGLYEPSEKLGLIKRSNSPSGDGGNYDGYRSRIIIPIHNRHGALVGLAGRLMIIDPNDKEKNFPKYINPPQSELYNKSATIFGLSKADKPINNEGYAYLVEGYFDVITLHANEEAHTIGTCGTALTKDMALIIKKYTGHVVVFRDGDAAGRAAAVKDIFILTENGFKSEIALLPDGEDPDSYKRKSVNKLYQDPVLQIQDAILWYIDSIVKDVFDDSYKLGQAQQQVIEFLLKIPNDIIRSNYLDTIVKKYQWKRKKLEERLNELVEQKLLSEEEDDGASHLDKMPRWMDREEFLTNGYCTINNKKRVGYYSMSGESFVEITNFIITPLFHIYAGKDSRHLIQIDNGRKKAVVDIESKALVSPDLLQQLVVCEGPYIIYGSKSQMLRIATNLLANFPRCIEVKLLGWQPSGFFAFVDKIFVPGEGLKELDEWGIYKHFKASPAGGGLEGANYLVPAASAAYKELQQTGEDPYEKDRVLTYAKGDITFSDWAALMNRVYKEKGPVGIAYVILSLFRDIVFDIDNNCPHLYGYGERSSGKSKWADSITAFFYKKRSAFNLNSGTDFAFFSYMQAFMNAPAQLNEFESKTMKPEWFQNIKGIFDGEGRQRGVMGSKNRTEIMKVKGTLILTGQFLVTDDDNSIVSRSIIEGFHEKERTDDDKKEFDRLKNIQEAGISHLLTDLLDLRPLFKEQYRDRFNQTLSEWAGQEEFNIRIKQNWCHLFTCWQLVSQKFSLPVTNDVFNNYCKHRALYWSNFIRSSDTLNEFWQTFAFLAEMNTIHDGWDYKIKEEVEIKIRKKVDNQEEEFTIQFPEPKKILYLRIGSIHKHYQLAYRQRTNKEGLSLENLLHYFSGRKYFLGNNKQSKFKKIDTITAMVDKPTGFPNTPVEKVAETRKVMQEKNTSSFVFLYDQLGIDIEKEQQENDPVPVMNGSGTGYREIEIPGMEEENLPFPKN